MTTASVAGTDAATSSAVQGVAKEQLVVPRHCDGCGGLLLVQLEAEAVPRRWGDVWWCTQCLCSIAAAEIDRQTQELPLRGVPLH
jgi:hypothetical protein